MTSHFKDEFTVKKIETSFQSTFGPCYRVGRNLTYFLPQNNFFVLTNLFFNSQQVGDLIFDLLYLWAGYCSIQFFWIDSPIQIHHKYVIDNPIQIQSQSNYFWKKKTADMVKFQDAIMEFPRDISYQLTPY